MAMEYVDGYLNNVIFSIDELSEIKHILIKLSQNHDFYV